MASALGRHPDPAQDLGIPPEPTHVAAGAGHLDLLSSAEVCAALRAWLVA